MKIGKKNHQQNNLQMITHLQYQDGKIMNKQIID
jgi:hypothetical protein